LSDEDMSERNPFLASGDWLQERLGTPALSIVDGSWYLPAHNRDGRAEFEACHIPGAVFFDQDRIVEPGSTLPHALPSPEVFARQVAAMGISEADTIVVHDGPGFFSAARVWWMFRIMGAGKVFLLDGGFDRWKAEGRPVTSEPTQVRTAAFAARFDSAGVVGFPEMMAIVRQGLAQVADARPAGRFTGDLPEPRPGMRSGHMPGALSVPSSELSRDGSVLPPDELRALFKEAGIDLSRPVVTTCGSGVTAAAISFALQSLGHEQNRLYDGSWSEWGGRPDTPVVVGGQRAHDA
jgi:thiosulfate/3-mercaptopyruvate sulfurtransferase